MKTHIWRAFRLIIFFCRKKLKNEYLEEENGYYKIWQVRKVCTCNIFFRCWWRNMLVTGVGDEMCWWQIWYKMLVTGFAGLVTNILYRFTLASGTNIQKMSPTSKFSHQHQQFVNSFKSPTSRCHQYHYHRKNQQTQLRLRIIPD